MKDTSNHFKGYENCQIKGQAYEVSTIVKQDTCIMFQTCFLFIILLMHAIALL